MTLCIYCRQPLTEPEPPEHVIPQGFGEFNATLPCVCAGCNGFFGSTLEWPMRNSSFEGVLRLNLGVAKGGQIGGVGTKGIEFRIAEPGDWMGARVLLKAGKHGKARTDLLPQIGARRNPTDTFTWYLEKEIDAAFAAQYPKGSEFRIIGSGNGHARLLKRLVEVCPSFQQKGTLAPPIGQDGKVGINFTHEFNVVVTRCLAKIAFNYLAWVAGPEFALRPEFDEVRSFIRYGIEPSGGIVYVSSRPILAQERFGGAKITEGHLLAVEAIPERHRVEVRLALFNGLSYRIPLSRSYGGIWFAKGHHFDIRSGEISELASTQIVRPVRVAV